MSLYLLHLEPVYLHAKHYLGFTEDHDVSRRVTPTERQSILPPDLFRRYENDSFWMDPALNLRRVRVV